MRDVATAITFVVVMAVVWLAAQALLRRRQRRRELQLLDDPLAQAAAAQQNDALVEAIAAQLPATGRAELIKDLHRAGHYRLDALKRYLALRNGLFIGLVLLTGVLAALLGPRHRDFVLVVIFGLGTALVALALPRVVLALNARQRLTRISAALPDALDTISMCLQGGISLQECLGYVGREMVTVHPDLALELRIVAQQADINSFEFAIQQFAARIDAPEVVALAAMVNQNQRLGTGVVESIRTFADELRLKRRQTAEARAGRLGLFLLFPVIFFLVPSILILLVGPPILQLIDFIRNVQAPVIPR